MFYIPPAFLNIVYDTHNWNPFSQKTKTCCTNTMAADDLVMQGAMASTGIVLT